MGFSAHPVATMVLPATLTLSSLSEGVAHLDLPATQLRVFPAPPPVVWRSADRVRAGSMLGIDRPVAMGSAVPGEGGCDVGPVPTRQEPDIAPVPLGPLS